MSEFLYRPLLEHLTVATNERRLDPYEAYAWLYEKRLALGLNAETYCSTSITSGGHARDDSLKFKDVISKNTESARLLAEQLATDGQLKPEAAVEPVFVGKTHWNQAEFMEFWLSVIGGYELNKKFMARDVNNLRTSIKLSLAKNDLDIDLMISKESAENRAAEYFKMSNSFASLITEGREATPIGAVIRMIDTEKSLGAQTERAFARQIGSKVLNICVMKPAKIEELGRVNRVLAKDTERLISFGAAVFDTANNKVRLVLTEDAA